MPKFNTQRARPRGATSVISTELVATAATFEGGPGYARDPKSELFLLAVANMVSEDTFYESAGKRDNRFEQLVHVVATEDPAWITQFLRWLRNDANMRSAALVGALEAARALIAAGVPGGRDIVASVLRRADEPGEALAYWLSRYGRKIPMPIKRGIADGALSNYSEHSLLKYDTSSHAVRFGDVIELTHPGDRKANQQNRFNSDSRGDWQRDLFKHALDRRHNRDNPIPESLAMLRANADLRASHPEGLPTAWLTDTDRLRAAGMTWEDALSLAGPHADKAKLWEALIPTMGYMALLRNLRNFDQAGISHAAEDAVAARLMNPEQVAKSKQFPFRFYSAYKAVQSLTWGPALERAVNASLSNVPALRGRTLVLVDQSPSMWPTYYDEPEHKGIENHELAKLFGSAIALRADDATLVGYGHASYVVPVPRGGSVLRLMDKFHDEGGTDAYSAARDHFAGHDRIVVITDGENNGRGPQSYAQAGIPAGVPIYTWNIGGLKLSQDPGGPNRHTFGGLTDQAFRMIPLLEAGTSTGWPWEQER